MEDKHDDRAPAKQPAEPPGRGRTAALIPGAREPETLTHREPASIGGAFTGADIPSAHAEWLDDRTAAEHYREGGQDKKSAEKKVRESHGGQG